MTYPTQVLAVIAMLLGAAYMALTLFLIRTFETTHRRPTPAVYLWPFNNELSQLYPRLTKLGRWIFVATILAVLPAILSLV
ncbi:MAG: hypothetical protein RLW62_13565 [Gammaproteobacteria bacterium]